MLNERQVRFWIAAIVVTGINVSLWISSQYGGGVSQMVRVAHASSAEELENTGRLLLRFDRAVYSDEQVAESIVHPPFRIEPPLEGEWVIQNKDEVAFEPRNRPRDGHLYRVEMIEGHRFFDVVDIDPDELPKVAYRPLELEHVQLITTRQGDGEDKGSVRFATIEALFNQPVSADDLARNLEVTSIGEQQVVTFLEEGSSERFRFEVPVHVGSQVQVKMNSGLHGVQGHLGLAQDSLSLVQIPRGFEMRWASGEASSYWSSGRPNIRLGFDRRIRSGQGMPKIVVTPEVPDMQARTSYSGITLTGSFKHEQTYTVELLPPLIAHDGSILDRAFKKTVRIPKARPRLSFPVSRGRIGPHGSYELDLQHCGITTMQLDVHRLLPQHLPVYLSGVMSDKEVPQLGEQLVSESIELGKASNELTDSIIDLERYMPRENGMYYVSIRSKNNRWLGDTMLVLVGQLGIEVKTHPGGLLAWVTDVSSGEPLTGARVVAWSSNRIELAEGFTDEHGLIQFDVKANACDLMTAHFEDDIVFIEPKKSKGIDDRSLAGAAWPGSMNVALYADRGIHRPGDTVLLTGTVRNSTGEILSGVPLEVHLTRPDKRVIFKADVETDGHQGTFHVELPTQASDPTGNWQVSVHIPGEKKSLSTLVCPIMPFLPVRLAIESTANPSEDVQGLLEVDVVAQYLHGGAAGNLPVKTRVSYSPMRYSNSEYPDYTFGLPAGRQKVAKTVKGITSPLGKTTLTVEGPSQLGTWKAHAQSTVMELGGRPTTSHTSAVVDTAPVHIGGRIVGGQLHRSTEPITVEVIRLDTQGNLQGSGEVSGYVVGIDNEWQLHSDSNGRRHWRSVEVATPIENLDLTCVSTSDGHWECRIPQLTVGAYRYIASMSALNEIERGFSLQVELDFHVTDQHAVGRMAAHQADRLELIAEHDKVVPGMKSSVLIRSPFPGKALVTIETDRICYTDVIDVTGDGVRMPFVVPESVRDTCFIGATVIRPLDTSRTQWLPLEAKGATRIHIDTAAHTVAVEIAATDASKPGEHVQVELSVPDAVLDTTDLSVSTRPIVHVWAVEEGALLVTDYQVPNLRNTFFKKRRRMVNSISSVNDLLPDYQRPTSQVRIGGDDRGILREPVAIRQPDINVIWKKSQLLPDDGILDLEFVMPDIDGAMRVMAVVVDGDRYGNVEHRIGVVPPMQIVAAFPRAVAPFDQMEIPVTIRNNTAVTHEMTLDLAKGNGIQGELPRSTLRLEPGGEEVLILTLIAEELGTVPVEINAVPSDENLAPVTFKRHIAVRPPHGRTQDIHRLYVEPGTTASIERNHALDELAGRVEITVGGNPSIELKSTLDDLIMYPYGCGEQVGSRTQGLLAAMQLDSEVSGYSSEELSAMVLSGIQKLWRLQNRDGGIGYWQGQTSDPWLTMRTALIALDAHDEDIELPEDFLEQLLSNIQKNIRSTSWAKSFRIQAMACRVLARAGTPDEAVLASLSTNINGLDIQSRAHLADAHFALGNLGKWDEFINAFVVPTYQPPTSSQWFTSDVSQASVALGVLLDRLDDHPMMPEYARYISDARGERGWRNTFENAEALGAMVRWNNRSDQTGTAKGVIHIAGNIIEFDGNDPVHYEFDIDGSYEGVLESVVSQGDGMVSVLIQASGVPTEDSDDIPVGHALSVTKRYMNANGVPLTGDITVEAGDVLIVELKVKSTTGLTHSNVAILDVLPGGLEFELPNLATSARGDVKTLASVDNVEFRDDRLIAFSSVGAKPVVIQYLARAVVPGTWSVPALDALSMYESTIFGRGMGSEMDIVLP